jgi:ankyrin repeat protein
MKKLLIIIGVTVGLNTSIVADPIHHAANRGDLPSVQKYLDEGVDPSVKNLSGLTPLYYATRQGYLEVAELLIAKGADVNAKDNNGETSRDRAILRNKGETANLLRKHGGKTGEELKAEGK